MQNNEWIKKGYIELPPIENLSRAKLADKYVETYAKIMNEKNEKGYKTILDSCIKKPFYITIYSKQTISNIEAYAISTSYRQYYGYVTYPTESNVLGYLKSFYPEVSYLCDRVKLFENNGNGLIIVLDIDPKLIKIDPEVIRLTKVFNEKSDNNKYKSILKAYIDFDIVVYTKFELCISDVNDIISAHRTAQSWAGEFEQAATCSEFLLAMEKSNFRKKIDKIKSYEYQHGFLTIEFE